MKEFKYLSHNVPVGYSEVRINFQIRNAAYSAWQTTTLLFKSFLIYLKHSPHNEMRY